MNRLTGRNRRRQLSRRARTALPGAASGRMSRQRTHDTSPERSLRSELHRRGLRFRIHARPLAAIRREADVVFTRARVAVFVDGCFWHGCPEHRTYPRRNASFWSDKIESNRVRDAETDSLLRAQGWIPLRVWEHESVHEAADRVEDVVNQRAGRQVTCVIALNAPRTVSRGVQPFPPDETELGSVT
jgi:DNA mismatch endonuclease (patch repair protein)